MVYPVYISIVTTINNRQHIIRTILDLHPSQLKRVVSQPDGLVSILTIDNEWMKLCITFEDLRKLLRELYPVDERYKEVVDSYAKNEYEGLTDELNGKDGAESN